MRWSFFPNTGEWRPMEKRQKKWQGRSGGAWVRAAGRVFIRPRWRKRRKKRRHLPQHCTGDFHGAEEEWQCVPSDGKYPGALHFSDHDLIQSRCQEAHRYLGFVRFQEMKGKLLYSEIEPSGQILPLIGDHFYEPLSGERFLIFDRHKG